MAVRVSESRVHSAPRWFMHQALRAFRIGLYLHLRPRSACGSSSRLTAQAQEPVDKDSVNLRPVLTSFVAFEP